MRNRSTWNLNRALGLVVLLVSVSSCSLSAGPLEGKVIDANTGAPIGGAVVVALWSGDVSMGVADSTMACFHLASTMTDDAGRYHFSAWKKSYSGPAVHRQLVRVFAHKTRYVFVDNKQDNVTYVSQFVGTREERLRYLKNVEESIRCPGRVINVDRKGLIPLYKMLYEEANRVAATAEDREIVRNLRYTLDTIELGWDEARRRYRESTAPKR